MEFTNPFMLWSALLVAIPIIFHFWHQKQGKLLNWAATSWLIEKKLQQARGIRLDNVLLLLLRCLLLIILALFLSKPIFNYLNINGLANKIHLVQPNDLLVNNYKFELEKALKKGEKIYWINSKTEPLNDISNIPSLQEFDALLLQTSLNKVFQENPKGQFELYLINNRRLSEASNVFVPSTFTLHTVVDSFNFPAKPYLEFTDKRKLFVNASHQLSSALQLDDVGKFEQKPTHFGMINVLLERQNKAEKQAFEAAFKAFAQVYQIEIAVDFERKVEKKYDFVFKDAFEDDISILVFSGQLPEYLGEILVKYYQLNNAQKPLSRQQLNSIFRVSENHSKISEDDRFSEYLLLFFIIILGIERWVAIKKNA